LRWHEWSISGANSEVPSDVNFVQWIFKRGWSMSLFGDYIIWIHMISPIVGWCLMSMSTFKANYWGYHKPIIGDIIHHQYDIYIHLPTTL
jgi:hypothetical protein